MNRFRKFYGAGVAAVVVVGVVTVLGFLPTGGSSAPSLHPLSAADVNAGMGAPVAQAPATADATVTPSFPPVTDTPTPTLIPVTLTPYTGSQADLAADVAQFAIDWTDNRDGTPPYPDLSTDQWLSRLAPHATPAVLREINAVGVDGLYVSGCLGPPTVRSMTHTLIKYRVFCGYQFVDINLGRHGAGWLVVDARTATQVANEGPS